MATYYVTTSGSNGNAGTSEGTAWADLGYAVTQATASGDVIYIKAGTYTMTTATPGASGPIVLGTNKLSIAGYETTPGDNLGTITISAGVVTGITLITLSGGFGSPQQVKNIEVDAVATSNNGFGRSGSHGHICDCTASNAGIGFNSVRATRCVADTCSTGFSSCLNMLLCVAIDCGTGTSMPQNSLIAGCYAINCTTGFSTSFYVALKNCIAVSCVNGFGSASTSPTPLYDCCLAASCTTGWLTAGSASFLDCAGYNNTADFSGTPFVSDGFISLSSDPFVDSGAGDYQIATSASDLIGLDISVSSQTFAAYRGLAEAAAGGSVLHPLYATGRR